MTTLAPAFDVPLPNRHTLRRPRLTERLEGPAALFVLRGGRGVGKSTLLAEWAHARADAATVVWLSIDESCAAPADFWAMAIESLIHKGLLSAGDAREIGAESAATTAAEAGVPPVSLEALKRALARNNAPMVFAIDDAELLHATTVAQVVELLSVVPSLTIAVATRMRGAFETGPVRLSVDTLVVEASELEFTPSETSAVLDAAGLPNRSDLVQLVRAICGGHPLATRATFAAFSSSQLPSATTLRHIVMETLGWDDTRAHALANADPVLAEFLSRASAVELITIEFAHAVFAQMAQDAAERAAAAGNPAAGTPAGAATDLTDPLELLSRIEQLGLGSWVGVPSGTIFRIAMVARNALRAELETRLFGSVGLPASVTTTSTLHFAAQWSAENGFLEQAFFLAIACNDFELATAAGRQCTLELITGHRAELHAALMPLSPIIMQQHPLLALLLAWTYNRVERGRARAMEYFGIVIEGTKYAIAGENPVERVIRETLASCAYRAAGQIELAVPAAKLALAGLAALSDSEREEIKRFAGVIAIDSGVSLLYGGFATAALETFRSVLIIDDELHDNYAIAAMAGTHAIAGDMRDAAELIAEHDAHMWSEQLDNDLLGTFFQLGRMWLGIENGDLAGAQRAHDSISVFSNAVESWAYFAEAQAMVDLFTASAAVGIDRINAVRRHKRGRVDAGPHSRQRLDIALSTLHLAVGRVRQADAVLVATKHPDAALLVAQARVQLVRDQAEQALRILAPKTVAVATDRVRAEWLAIESAAQLRLGHASVALTTLERLLVTLDRTGLRTPLALITVEDAAALRSLAAEHGLVAGEQLFADGIPAVLHRQRAINLSERESVVLRKLVDTSSTADIAEDLFVSVNTVKSQLRSLYRKLGVSSREEALVVAMKKQLLDPTL